MSLMSRQSTIHIRDWMSTTLRGFIFISSATSSRQRSKIDDILCFSFQPEEGFLVSQSWFSLHTHTAHRVGKHTGQRHLCVIVANFTITEEHVWLSPAWPVLSKVTCTLSTPVQPLRGSAPALHLWSEAKHSAVSLPSWVDRRCSFFFSVEMFTGINFKLNIVSVLQSALSFKSSLLFKASLKNFSFFFWKDWKRVDKKPTPAVSLGFPFVSPSYWNNNSILCFDGNLFPLHL